MKKWYAIAAVVLAAVAAKAAPCTVPRCSLNSPSSSEGAVPRSWSVNPTRLTCRNEPDSDDLCRDGAFISDDVHVVATSVNKRPPSCHTLIRTAPSDNPFVHCRDSQTCESGRTKLKKILNWSNWPWARGVLVNPLAGVAHAGLA